MKRAVTIWRGQVVYVQGLTVSVVQRVDCYVRQASIRSQVFWTLFRNDDG